MSCSFTRRSSMSVMTLLSTNRPASVIETTVSPPLHSTLAFSEAPTTSTSSVFNVNYLSNCSSPTSDDAPASMCYCEMGLAENNNLEGVGLYDEILSALESKKDRNEIVDEKFETPNEALIKTYKECNSICRLGFSDLVSRDHVNVHIAQAKISRNSRFNKKDCRSQTTNPVVGKYFSHPKESFEVNQLEKRSRSCVELRSQRHRHRSDCRVPIESLSNFATNIRRLSSENTLLGANPGDYSQGNDLLPLVNRPRQILTLPSKTIPVHQVHINSLSDHPRIPHSPNQPFLQEFV